MKIITRIKVNGKVLFKYFLSVWGIVSALASLVLAFVSWEDFGIVNLSHKILILIGIAILSLIIGVVFIFVINRNTIFGNIDKGLSIQYGDVIKLGFDNSGKSKKIIVIPVNRCFDLSCENNLIAEKSIHGQWISKFISSERIKNETHQKIETFLNEQKAQYIELDKSEKKSGYCKRYSPGTIVELSGANGVNFYLWGVSEFDKDLKANCTELDYYKAIQNLIDYYDSHGQCVDIYCPVIGDHIIRPTKPTEDVLHFMISILKINKSKIHGNIHIVVYNQKKADVSILKY